jgi:hypothetical protein
MAAVLLIGTLNRVMIVELGVPAWLVALWKQEARDPSRTAMDRARPALRDAWRALRGEAWALRRLVAVGLGTVAFSMQDMLLEPYGGQILHLPVGMTTRLTALIGLLAFSAAMFGIGTLSAAMARANAGQTGLALGTWGAVQASAAGVAIALAGCCMMAARSSPRAARWGRRPPIRRPAMNASICSKSSCCSPPSRPSARWCVRLASGPRPRRRGCALPNFPVNVAVCGGTPCIPALSPAISMWPGSRSTASGPSLPG